MKSEKTKSLTILKLITMKRFMLICLAHYSLIMGVMCQTFNATNDDGDIFRFTVVNDSVVTFETNSLFFQNEYIYKDTLRLPATIEYEGSTYYVMLPDNSLMPIGNSTPIHPKVLIIPNTYYINPFLFSFPDSTKVENGELYYTSTLIDYQFEPPHTSYSIYDGVIYSKNLDTLFLFPAGRCGLFNIPETVRHLGSLAFLYTSLDSVVIPNSVESFDPLIFCYAQRLRSFKYPNSLKRLPNGCDFIGNKLEEIIFGSGLEYLGGTRFGSRDYPKLKRVVCLAVTPPVTTVQQFYGSDSLTLFVPRKSIGLYRQAQGWSTFPAIEPIEPPVVSGVNNAEISWVTNAEASSYSLTLYLDSAQTRRLLTLTFDDRGYLQNMDINPDVYSSAGAPAFDGYAALSSMPSRVRQAHEEETPETEVNEEQFNTYLSFTVTGLRACSEYFFVRRTYNAMNEVIDEEHGSFETLTDTETGLDGSTVPYDERIHSDKQLREGQVLIIAPDGKTYTPDGKGLK